MVSFGVNAHAAWFFFTKNTRNTLKISPTHSWTTLHCQNDRLCAPDAGRQDLVREHSTLHYVTLTLDIYQVCDCVGLCVKNRSCSYQAQQWKSMANIAGISTNVRCCYPVVYNNFVFQQDHVLLKDSGLAHLAFNTVQLLQCKTLNFLSAELWPRNSPEHNSTDYEI